MGRTHCKACVEAGRAFEPRATPTRTHDVYAPTIRSVSPEPKPVGPPTRGFFIMGFIGMLLLMSVGMVNWINDTTGFFTPWFLIPPIPTPVYMISLILVCSSIVVASIAFYGYRRNYGSTMSLATFIISLIFPWFLLISKLLLTTGLVFVPYTTYYYTYWMPGPLYLHYIALYIVGSALIGVLFILWGCALIVVRKYTGKAGLPIASGIIFIIAGSFWCSIFLYPVGSILLIPAGILWMISLATSRIPEEFVY